MFDEVEETAWDRLNLAFNGLAKTAMMQIWGSKSCLVLNTFLFTPLGPLCIINYSLIAVSTLSVVLSLFLISTMSD